MRTWVNDVLCVTLYDPLDRSGFIALQLHGGQDVEVLFKDIRILLP